jgi:hypothetical protein
MPSARSLACAGDSAMRLTPPALLVRAGAAVPSATAITIIAKDAQALREAAFDDPAVEAGPALALSDASAVVATVVDGQEFGVALTATTAVRSVVI